MEIVYSDHTKKRMKQRGITDLEIVHVLQYPTYVKNHLLKQVACYDTPLFEWFLSMLRNRSSFPGLKP